MMALDKTILGAAMCAKVLATPAGTGHTVGSVLSEEQLVDVRQQWLDIADVIISHIRAYGEVTVTVPAGTVLIAATGGVPNSTPIKIGPANSSIE